MKIDPMHVPEQFRHLIPLAEKWGISDDGYRADAIEAASRQEIAELKVLVLPLMSRLYREWLGNTIHMDTPARAAYLAFTALGLAAEESQFTKIDPVHVPEQFRHLIPLAEKWGINDDGYRADAIAAASKEEIAELKAAVLPLIDRIILEWLGDTSQMDISGEDAYIAFTALTLAAEEC